jgi:hypothetical protein
MTGIIRDPIGRALLVLLLSLLAPGCQSEPSGNFLERTAEDCRSGDAGACELLSDLRPNGVTVARPRASPTPVSPVQRDVAAILEGMRRAHTSQSQAPSDQQAPPATADPAAPDQQPPPPQ